ncbi:sensor of ECF-type sigma factor [Flavobacterium gawalongense]|uniref:Sensor of ECF-type sigma factor n=1 Tax=Flavobacterium gawalongense TaxID=2594432 RepID=A0A553BFL2_9FLAO|nr:sensor of ECF-type sigma factor [Flavobacterium gawalongense]TRX00250.1 sensor of ECF-type sigma factor [Flavobacterium gawalongense]TRX05367.1 sensor of ECF-type sigma factor [Flavobacterium gawalongense]TRX07035.1 sensor of ECF-type sigma factor [Flavobacterium gawalongense]TRX10303.1 sensor of ECF-type sigma factor [Flavobacterium gawalongense]TRX27689.1 sensor of ECF-type sigma factor [Flavobacterium gawalongense]
MNFKKLFPILLLFVSFNFYAQGEKMKEKKEQIKALKVAFLTTELDLTANEAEKFWPIYNTFDDKQFELRHQKMKTFMRKMNDGSLDKMTEKEANTFLTQMESTEEELFLLRKKFMQNLKGIFPAVKIIKLRKAEEDFNRKLLQQYRNKGPKR